MLLALLPWAAGAQSQAPGLAARVNGVGISLEKLERSFEEYLRERQIPVAAVRRPERIKTLKRETLELLIDQELVWQEAARSRVMVGPGEVEQVLDQLRARFPSPEAFAARLQTEGYTETTYREHLRRLLSARLLLERAAAGSRPGPDGARADDAQPPVPEDAAALIRRLRAGARIEILLPL